jgi:signal transduction histidine kinase
LSTERGGRIGRLLGAAAASLESAWQDSALAALGSPDGEAVGEGPVGRAVMRRAYAYLYGAGGTLVLLTLAIPSSGDRFLAGMIGPALAAYVIVALMLVAPAERLPLALLRTLSPLGAVLVTVVAYSSATGAANAYALLYFWVIVSSFYFFALPLASASLAIVAAGYAMVLMHHSSADDRLLYWVMGMGTLAGAGLLLSLLRERIERLVRAMRDSDLLKTTIIRSVSHDFRTPLTAIIAAGESSASPTLDAETRREAASVIVTEASRLSETLAKLLEMSRLEAGAAAPHRSSCSIEEVIEVALEHTPAGESFDVRADSPLPAVWADAGQLERAFANVLENAGRFARPDQVQVTLEANDENVLVRVSDRGPGIAPEDRERIFEPFYSGHRDAGGYRGPGLGLAIARGFIETNGGRVWVESERGRGTTFVVELPEQGAGEG